MATAAAADDEVTALACNVLEEVHAGPRRRCASPSPSLSFGGGLFHTDDERASSMYLEARVRFKRAGASRFASRRVSLGRPVTHCAMERLQARRKWPLAP
eukprot:6196885-Pleurochrysis_carterae.AAC.1